MLVHVHPGLALLSPINPAHSGAASQSADYCGRGTHHLPRGVLPRDCPAIDLCVLGEGEETISQLASRPDLRGPWGDVRVSPGWESIRCHRSTKADSQRGGRSLSRMGIISHEGLPRHAQRTRWVPRSNGWHPCDAGLSLSVHVLLQSHDVWQSIHRA